MVFRFSESTAYGSRSSAGGPLRWSGTVRAQHVHLEVELVKLEDPGKVTWEVGSSKTYWIMNHIGSLIFLFSSKIEDGCPVGWHNEYCDCYKRRGKNGRGLFKCGIGNNEDC